MKAQQKEVWVDNVKVIACILVAIGHFFQSMTASGIYSSHDILIWFDQTIYYFHVPLFFICSGYLYQKYSRVNSPHTWMKNIQKKALTLGVPYVAFTIATWTLKTVFSDSVNTQADGFFYTLFLAPTSQLWYLYCLFFIFLLTPTFSSKKTACIGLLCAVFFKIAALAEIVPNICAVSTVFSNEIWFVLGMCLCMTGFPQCLPAKYAYHIGIILSVLFLTVSVWSYTVGFSFFGISFFMGIIACTAIITIVAAYFTHNEQNSFFSFLSRYTLPIYVMHTIFAAGLRSVLLKFGCNDILLHSIGGISISFIGPIIAAEVMKATKWLEFLLYPSKFTKAR